MQQGCHWLVLYCHFVAMMMKRRPGLLLQLLLH
jgi:hypothetical protein